MPVNKETSQGKKNTKNNICRAIPWENDPHRQASTTFVPYNHRLEGSLLIPGPKSSGRKPSESIVETIRKTTAAGNTTLL